MTIDDQIRVEKLQFDINRVAAIISAISSGKTDQCEYLTDEEILPSNQKQIIEQAKFTYSPLGKVFEKQIKTIQDQGKKTTNWCFKRTNWFLKKKRKKAIEDKSNDKPSMQKKFYNRLLKERKSEMQ